MLHLEIPPNVRVRVNCITYFILHILVANIFSGGGIPGPWVGAQVRDVQRLFWGVALLGKALLFGKVLLLHKCLVAVVVG